MQWALVDVSTRLDGVLGKLRQQLTEELEWIVTAAPDSLEVVQHTNKKVFIYLCA